VTATAAEADLRPRTAAADIDRLLETALRTRRPVSISIAADVARAPMLVAPRRTHTVRRQDAGLAIGGSDGEVSRKLATTNTAPSDAHVAGQSGASQWSALADFLSPGDLVLADVDALFTGAATLTLPHGAKLITQPIWAWPGWALSSALGASLAAPDRRVIVIGDDSALQRGSAELSTLLAYGALPILVTRVTDRGSASERAARMEQMLRVAAVTCDPPLLVRASTGANLARALREAGNAGRPVLIEISVENGASRTQQRESAVAAA